MTILTNQVTMDRRAPPPFPNTPDYINHSSKVLEYITQPGKTLPKELVSPRYRAYPPLEMFSFPQSPISQDGTPGQQQPIPTPRSRPGFLRRADSLVSSTELALFRRVHEAQQEALQESQYRQQVLVFKAAYVKLSTMVALQHYPSQASGRTLQGEPIRNI